MYRPGSEPAIEKEDAKEYRYRLPSGEECRNEGSKITITPTELRELEGGCRFRSVKITGEKMPPATKTPRAEWVPSAVEIVARCEGEGSVSLNKLRLMFYKWTLQIENETLREIDSEQKRLEREEQRKRK